MIRLGYLSLLNNFFNLVSMFAKGKELREVTNNE